MDYLPKTLISNINFNRILISYILFVIILQISANINLKGFNYAKTFELENDGILVCTENGVYLYVKALDKLNPISQASFSSHVSKEDLGFLTINQFEQGEKYIIVAYKTIIYIFTSQGEYYTKGNIDFTPQLHYYTLVPYKVDTTGTSIQYYFLIGYLGNDNILKFLYTNYYFNENKIINKISGGIFRFSNINTSYVNTFSGFSCQIMNSGSYGNVLTCFFNFNEKMIVGSFNLENFLLIEDLYTTSESATNPNFINSVISNDKKKVLVCYLQSWRTCQCEKYDINANTLSPNSNNVELNNLNCAHQNPASIIMYYSKKTNEYFFGCFGYNYDLLLTKFNSNFEVEYIIKPTVYIYNEQKNQTCATLSIINSINNNDYSILVGCENKGVLFNDDLPEGMAPSLQEQKTQKVYRTIPETKVNNIKEITTENIITTINQKILFETTFFKNQEINQSTEKEIPTTIVEQDTDSKQITNKEYTTTELIQNIIIKTSEIIENIIIQTTELIEYVNPSTSPLTSPSTSPLTSPSTSPINSQSNSQITLISTSPTTVPSTSPLTIPSTSISIYNIKNETCSEEFLYQNTETKECLNYCSSQDLINKKCILNKIANSNINDIAQNIRNIIKQENITKDTNYVIEGGNTIYQFISSEKMADNENTNMSVIDLGDCEKKLLDEYNLDYLLIFKMDSKLDENTAVILNYEIYNPYTNDKLNLSLCSDMKIYTFSSYFPPEKSINKIKQLSELGYDLYDINNEFYQDLCSPFTSENGTDILLSDRKSDFYENVSLCENDCNYNGYDLEKKRVKCECPVKEEIKMEESGNNNKNILEDFFDGSNFSNIKLLKCFKLVFSLNGQKNNKGSIIFLSIIFCLIVLGIIYGIKQEQYIIRNITKIINEKYKGNPKSNVNNDMINIKSPITKVNSFPPKKQKNKLNKKSNLVIFNYVNNINNNNNMTNSISNLKRNNYAKKKVDVYKTNERFESQNNKEERIEYDKYNFIDEELNSLSYDLAFKYDKRTYFQYYLSLLKQKHLIVFTFCNNKDYNILVLKLSLLLSSFALYFAVNALFFNDSTMHDIYEQSGNSTIISQISNIFYSTIISSFINIVIKKLGLSNNDMIRIKQIPNETEGLRQSIILMKKLKIKFAIFFCLTFILVSFFWYFISAFCAVYKNTQNILIENTFLSFFLSLLYPFGINLIPGLLRIHSLKNYSSCSKGLYFISKLIALI